MFIPGVPFTPSNVMRVIRETLEFFLVLMSSLFLPDTKQKEIMQKFPDEFEKKKLFLSYWINNDPLASWRRLITTLDGLGETHLANSIRHNAEPLAGKSTHCTLLCILLVE